MPDRARPESLDDREVEAELRFVRHLHQGFRDLDLFEVTVQDEDGGRNFVSRQMLRTGPVIALLPVDLARDRVVLIRQFRPAAHLALGIGELVEIVAGHVENGEDAETALRREAVEEIGLEPSRLAPMFHIMPAPGASDENARFFVGAVDSAALPESAGAVHENESTRPFSLPISEALEALAAGRLHNGYTVLALQWLALNRARLSGLLGA